MYKSVFMDHVRALYRAANMADQPDQRPEWMKPAMAGDAGCAALDLMLHNMVGCGALTESELQQFHDTL